MGAHMRRKKKEACAHIEEKKRKHSLREDKADIISRS